MVLIAVFPPLLKNTNCVDITPFSTPNINGVPWKRHSFAQFYLCINKQKLALKPLSHQCSYRVLQCFCMFICKTWLASPPPPPYCFPFKSTDTSCRAKGSSVSVPTLKGPRSLPQHWTGSQLWRAKVVEWRTLRWVPRGSGACERVEGKCGHNYEGSWSSIS